MTIYYQTTKCTAQTKSATPIEIPLNIIAPNYSDFIDKVTMHLEGRFMEFIAGDGSFLVLKEIDGQMVTYYVQYKRLTEIK